MSIEQTVKAILKEYPIIAYGLALVIGIWILSTI
jgi:hypothetical protein